MPEGFTTKAVTAITQVSARRLGYWHTQGVLTPSVAAPPVRTPRVGRGVTGRRPGSLARRYSRADLDVVVLVSQLTTAGIPVRRIAEAVRVLARRFGTSQPLHEALRGERFHLVIPTRGQIFIGDEQGLWSGVERGVLQGYMLPLHRTAQTAAEAIELWRRRQARDEQREQRRHGAVSGRRGPGRRLATTA